MSLLFSPLSELYSFYTLVLWKKKKKKREHGEITLECGHHSQFCLPCIRSWLPAHRTSSTLEVRSESNIMLIREKDIFGCAVCQKRYHPLIVDRNVAPRLHLLPISGVVKYAEEWCHAYTPSHRILWYDLYIMPLMASEEKGMDLLQQRAIAYVARKFIELLAATVFFTASNHHCQCAKSSCPHYLLHFPGLPVPPTQPLLTVSKFMELTSIRRGIGRRSVFSTTKEEKKKMQSGASPPPAVPPQPKHTS